MQLRRSGLTWHVAGEDVVVLDVEGSVYLKLNRSGRVLWERLAEPSTDADLRSALVDEFEVDEERASADVDAFLNELRRRTLLDESR